MNVQTPKSTAVDRILAQKIENLRISSSSSTFFYIRMVVTWVTMVALDAMTGFRFELLWPTWLMVRAAVESIQMRNQHCVTTIANPTAAVRSFIWGRSKDPKTFSGSQCCSCAWQQLRIWSVICSFLSECWYFSRRRTSGSVCIATRREGFSGRSPRYTVSFGKFSRAHKQQFANFEKVRNP